MQTAMIPQLWTQLNEEDWQKERKRIRALQDAHFREKGDEKE